MVRKRSNQASRDRWRLLLKRYVVLRALTAVTYLGGVINRRTGWKLSRFNAWIYRATRGALGDATPGARVLLLTTVGRKTGRRHTVPVASWPLNRDLIIGSHAGGAKTDPDWLRNVRANRHALVQLKGETFAVEATAVSDAERDALVEEVAAVHPAIRFYDRRTPRRAALVRLTRSAE